MAFVSLAAMDSCNWLRPTSKLLEPWTTASRSASWALAWSMSNLIFKIAKAFSCPKLRSSASASPSSFSAMRPATSWSSKTADFSSLRLKSMVLRSAPAPSINFSTALASAMRASDGGAAASASAALSATRNSSVVSGLFSEAFAATKAAPRDVIKACFLASRSDASFAIAASFARSSADFGGAAVDAACDAGVVTAFSSPCVCWPERE